jgi:hypothetical protein
MDKDMTGLDARALASFVRAVAILALPADGQIAWLHSLDLPGQPRYVDELALEFDDGYLLSPQFVTNGWLAQEATKPLAALNVLLSDMSGSEHAELWTLDALATSPLWIKVRHQARVALFLM